MRPPTKERKHVPRPSIWIVDRVPSDYRCLTVEATNEQFNISFLKSANELLRRWPLVQPDVCLVNVQLPGLSGFDLLEMLRPFPASVTVGVVENHYSPENELQALILGASFYFCKPLDRAVLAECCACRKLARRSYS